MQRGIAEVHTGKPGFGFQDKFLGSLLSLALSSVNFSPILSPFFVCDYWTSFALPLGTCITILLSKG